LGLHHPNKCLPSVGVDTPIQRSRDRRRRVTAGVGDPCACHPPGLARRDLAAGQRDGPQVTDALEALEPSDKQLAAPLRAVGAVAATVIDRAYRGADLAVLGEHRGEMRVMVLDTAQ